MATRRVRFSADALLGLCREGSLIKVLEGTPAGTRLLSVYLDPACNELTLTVEADQFQDVDLSRVPEVPVVMEFVRDPTGEPHA